MRFKPVKNTSPQESVRKILNFFRRAQLYNKNGTTNLNRQKETGGREFLNF